MKDEKSLGEFSCILSHISYQNVLFEKNPYIPDFSLIGKYKDELSKVQELINSFDFVKKKKDSNEPS